MTATLSSKPLRRTMFGGLVIAYDDGVLEPRPWTVLQSQWAVELAEEVASGPMLEVCSGAGQIGLVAAVASGRELVQVDIDPHACSYARLNADAAGLAHRVEVRCATLEETAAAGDRYPLILADPPYIARSAVHRFPDDPVLAIDGGPDGLDLARACVDLFRSVLTADGVALLQLGGSDHVEALTEFAAPDLRLVDRRIAGPTRCVALLARNDPPVG